MEHCRVARFYFVDFPLGNPCGKPYDLDMQRQIVSSALSMFESTHQPTMVEDSNQWGSDQWRKQYMEIQPEDRERLKRAGEDRRLERQRLRDIGQVRTE